MSKFLHQLHQHTVLNLSIGILYTELRLLLLVTNEDKTGGACGTLDRSQKCVQNIFRKVLREGTTPRLMMLMCIILKYMLQEQDMSVDWIRLAQKSDQYLVLIHTFMNSEVPEKACNSLTSLFTTIFSRRTKLHRVN
jgi:hypothetical protein